MTREEAIDILQNTSFFGRTIDDIDTAIDMAIQALEQEPCEDCISRQATVERLCKVAEFMNEKRNGLGSPYVMAALFIQDNKDEFPSVTSQPKMGRWKRISMDKYVQHAMAYYKCSECGGDIIGEHNYCPNCGAKMEVKENG